MADVGEPGQELPGGGACDSLLTMAAADSHDTEGLKAALVAAEARAAAAAAKVSDAEAKVSDAEAQVAALTLMIEKLRRALYGRRSERKERLLDQLELALDELTASATEDELAAGKAAARTTEVSGFVRRKPSRKPFPEHLPRERYAVSPSEDAPGSSPAPTAGACGLLSCTRSSAPRSSTTSTRRPGSPMSSTVSPTCRRPVCTNSCPGPGRPTGNRPWPHSSRPPPNAYGSTHRRWRRHRSLLSIFCPPVSQSR